MVEHFYSRLFLSFALAAAFAGALIAQNSPVPPTTKRVPPVGVAIPDVDRKLLETGVAELAAAIQQIPKSADADALLPDVEVFLKAVDWPLRYDEFFDVKQTGSAKTLLAEGI